MIYGPILSKDSIPVVNKNLVIKLAERSVSRVTAIRVEILLPKSQKSTQFSETKRSTN